MSIRTFFSSDTGELLEFITSSRDVTERKEAEALILESEMRLRESQQMLENVLETIFTRTCNEQADSGFPG
jgi:hypothetical protein